ncbi:RNA polymerase sigma factor [Candidatus Saccharibacteria bacterium]|nr:RNA polymerase sigma factor [Candidatus Saccharibacteria bacterium]
MTDKQIVTAVIAGEPSAYRAIVERYQQPLVRYIAYLIHDADLTDDVVQDTFIKAYKNLRGFRLDAKFSSWLYRIAHNTAMDAVKHQHLSIDDLPARNEPVSQDLDIAALVDQHIAAKDVAACLTKLPLKYREAIALFYLREASYSEISDILHISVSGVGVRINRAKTMLRSICKARGVHQ